MAECKLLRMLATTRPQPSALQLALPNSELGSGAVDAEAGRGFGSEGAWAHDAILGLFSDESVLGSGVASKDKGAGTGNEGAWVHGCHSWSCLSCDSQEQRIQDLSMELQESSSGLETSRAAEVAAQRFCV